MALSFVGSATNSAIDGADVTVTLPGGVATNDVVYAAYGIADNDNNDYNMTMITTGYTELADVWANDTLEANLGVYRKIMGVTPDSTYQVDGLGGLDSGASSACHVWSGADTSTPEDVATTTNSGIDTFIPDPPSIDWSTAGVVVLAIGVGSRVTAGPNVTAAPTNYINLAWLNANDSNSCSVMIASRSDPSDPEDPGVFSISTTDNANNAWCAATVAIRPAGGGGGATTYVGWFSNSLGGWW